MSDKKPPQHWGTSAAAFYADCEDEQINIHVETGQTLSGVLLGVDRYDLILERDDGAKVLIPKHAVVLIEPGSAIESME